MEKFKVSFEANNQQLKAIGTKHASDTYADIEATFVLGEKWTDMDTVSAVWWNDFTRVATVLDSQGKCTVPHEVLARKGCVRVNLVGSIVEGDELITRLTSYSAEAVQVNEKIKLTGNETSEITPSQYEQFAANVKADADRAEAGADEAEQSAQNASESATASANSATSSAQSATASEGYAQNASESAQDAETAKDDAEDARDKILGMRATAETLEAGSDATASYSDGLLTLGIPRGDKGVKGDKGDTGATPQLSIGTVTTLPPSGSSAVTITGTAENPVLNFGLVKGDTGEVSQAELDEAVTNLKSDKVDKVGFKQIDELNTTFFTIGANRYNVDDVTDGVQLNQSSEGTHAQSGFSTTNNYCYVGDLTSIKFYRRASNGTQYNDSAYYQLYDANQQRIGNRQLDTSVDVSSATWIKVSNSTQYKSSFMILSSSITPTEYIPFVYMFDYFEGANPKDTADKVSILEKQGMIQLIDTGNMTLGKYYEHNTNVKVSSSSAAILSAIRIYKGVKYSFEDLYAYFCNILYDGSGSYEALSSAASPDLQNGKFTAEENGYIYVTLSISSDVVQGDPQLYSNYVIPSEETTVIKPSTSDILQVLVDNKGKDIYFDAGNYDVIAIYKAHYGNDFFDNYTNYSSDVLCRGIPVYHGTTMKFSPNARFTANYSGNNTNVRQNFSAFAFEGGVTFDGLNIVASGIRNIIHDDFDNTYVGNTVIKNCHFVHDYIIIAGGMAVHETVEIYNNYFERTDTTTHVFDFSYHQNESSSAQSELIIKDNYCSKGISIRYYGTSTLITDCLISNNSMANDVEYRAENSSATIQNMRVLKWNNEIRS